MKIVLSFNDEFYYMSHVDLRIWTPLNKYLPIFISEAHLSSQRSYYLHDDHNIEAFPNDGPPYSGLLIDLHLIPRLNAPGTSIQEVSSGSTIVKIFYRNRQSYLSVNNIDWVGIKDFA